jgi:hypothetical protein
MVVDGRDCEYFLEALDQALAEVGSAAFKKSNDR